jgi:hypothetical protein
VPGVIKPNIHFPVPVKSNANIQDSRLGTDELLAHQSNLIFSCLCLFTSGYSKVVGVLGTGAHLAPLKRDEQTGDKQDPKRCLGPSQSRTLESIHLAFYLFEVFFGCWLLCKGVDWLGYLDWRRSLGGWGALLGGLSLFIHGGVSVTQQLLERASCY